MYLFASTVVDKILLLLITMITLTIMLCFVQTTDASFTPLFKQTKGNFLHPFCLDPSTKSAIIRPSLMLWKYGFLHLVLHVILHLNDVLVILILKNGRTCGVSQT